MKTSTINSSLWALVSIVGAATFAPSCGDGDPTTNPDTGKGGSGNRGGSAGRGGSTGGSVTGGDAGTSGSAGQGGTAGGGRGGTSGTSGSAGASGMGGEGGEAGAMGGEGGEGGMTTVTLYDFESGVQGWGTTTAGASVAQSTDQHVDGANALKVTHAVIDNSSLLVSVNGPPVWPGTVLTFHAFLPAGLDTTGGTYFQTFAQADNYKIGFDTAGNSSRTAVPGGWTTWTYTMPNTFPGGLQVLGFQLGDNSGGGTIAAGNIYLDAVTATGGVANCAIATPAGLHDFETALPTNPPVYVVDGAQTTIAQATDRAFAGTGSLKVSFANLPAPTGADPTKRIIYIDKPNVYCGQTMTFHVFLPTGSDGLTFQLYAQYDNFGTFTGTGPQTVIRNAWNTATYTIPTTVGPGGIQRVGMEFMYSGTAPLTGDAWVDAITW